VAESFDELCERTMTKEMRDRADQRARELMGEMLLIELRKLTGKSQREVAAALGIRQPSLSKLEGQSDMHISTLQRIVTALGGKLEVIVRLPKGTVRIDQFDGDTKSRRARRAKVPAEPQLA